MRDDCDVSYVNETKCDFLEGCYEEDENDENIKTIYEL